MLCPSYTYRLEFATWEGHPRRGVAFLISSDRRITATHAFDRLGSTVERTLRKRFDTWQQGIVKDNWYHGWTKSQFQGRYAQCYVFKCKENRLEHRFYGFLCNPKKLDPRYQICVLVCYATKSKWQTDESELKRAEETRVISAVQGAIKEYFGNKP